MSVTRFIPTSVFAASARQKTTCAQDYVIQANDWLSKLAEKQYGDVLAYPLIVETTRVARLSDESYATITDPDLIEIGWKVCLENSDGAPVNTGTMSDSGLLAVTIDTSGNWDLDTFEIYLVSENTGGNNLKQLTYNSEFDFYPTWSPDSEEIAFGTNRDGNKVYDIRI